MKEEILLPLTAPDMYKGTHLQITVRYKKGGMGIYSYRHEPRGYWLSVGIMGIENRENGIQIRSFGLFSATTVLIEEAKRLNAKRLVELQSAIAADVDNRTGKVWELATQVLTKQGRELAAMVSQ